MSDSEEDSGSVGRQKSIFSGMGRVKQINHLREKWSPKPKSPLPDRAFVESPPSSPWSRRPSPDKYAQGPYAGDSGRRTPHRGQSVNGSPRRQPVVTVVDMERYLAINTWLEHNGINVAQINTSPDKRDNSKEYGLFDDMYSSLDVLENSLMSELAYLNYSRGEDVAAAKNIEQKPSDTLSLSSPALFDYLVVIAPDMVDVTIRNFWSLRENVFEATVAFAHPPESQFRAESLEHFCFPTGIKAVNANAGTNVEKLSEAHSTSSSLSSQEGEFFVLMISGGGVQGQSVQYAMCMKGTVQVRDGSGDGKFLLLPICYCMIAQIPFIPFFRAVLQGLLDNLRNELEAHGCSGSQSLTSIVTDKATSTILCKT